MDKLDGFVAKRRTLVERYNKAFENISEIVTPKQVDGCNNSYHLYVIQVNNRLDAVSYTHLDVYKRQHIFFGSCKR